MFQGKDPCFQQLGQFLLANDLVDDAYKMFHQTLTNEMRN